MNVGELRKALEGVDDESVVMLDLVQMAGAFFVITAVAPRDLGRERPIHEFGEVHFLDLLRKGPRFALVEPRHRAMSCGVLAPGAGVPGGKR